MGQVEEQDVIVITILGYFFALMKFVGEPWRLKGMCLARLVKPELELRHVMAFRCFLR